MFNLFCSPTNPLFCLAVSLALNNYVVELFLLSFRIGSKGSSVPVAWERRSALDSVQEQGARSRRDKAAHA